MSGAVVVTGSSGAIGVAICAAFSKAGYRVVGLDRIGAQGICDDFLQVDLERAVAEDEYRRVALKCLTSAVGDQGCHALVNNAAVQIVKPVGLATLEEWQRTFAVNLHAPFVLTQSLLPALTLSHGSVVNITSIHAIQSKPGFCAYATSKAALVSFTRGLALDLSPAVRANAVAPAAVDTPMLREGLSDSDALAMLAEHHPANRIGRPDEIARAVMFLASKDAEFITGTTMFVDGGISGRLHDPI
ncbi:MAG: SDR family oxidoreductase [Actinomycetia bacterium]|nr:SDR family oxidoreductase [Actinomycetes bacterium]